MTKDEKECADKDGMEGRRTQGVVYKIPLHCNKYTLTRLADVVMIGSVNTGIMSVILLIGI